MPPTPSPFVAAQSLPHTVYFLQANKKRLIPDEPTLAYLLQQTGEAVRLIPDAELAHHAMDLPRDRPKQFLDASSLPQIQDAVSKQRQRVFLQLHRIVVRLGIHRTTVSADHVPMHHLESKFVDKCDIAFAGTPTGKTKIPVFDAVLLEQHFGFGHL